MAKREPTTPPLADGDGTIDFAFARAAKRYNSIEDLRKQNMAAVKDDDRAAVLGYYNPGDKGGGEFYYDAKSTEEDNGGTVIAPNKGGGRWKRLSSKSHIDVKWFGAKGDGITDDTDKFSACLDIADSDTTIYIPSGQYNLSTWSTYGITKTTKIKSQGITKPSIVGPGGVDFLSVSSGSLEVDSIDISGFGKIIEGDSISTDIDYLKIKNCRLSGVNPIYSRSASGVKIGLIEIENNYIYGSSSPCQIGTSYDRCLIDKNVSEGGQRGFRIGENDFDRQNEWQNTTFTSNWIKDINRPNGECQGVLIYGWKADINNNILENISNNNGTDCEGIYLKVRYGTVSSNILVNAGVRDASINIKGQGRTETEAPQGFAINVFGNVILFDDSTEKTVGSVGINIEADDVNVYGNIIEGSRGPAMRTSPRANRNVRFHNNSLLNLRSYAAVQLFSFDKCQLTNNLIFGVNREDSGEVNAIYIRVRSEAAGDIVISDNDIYNLSTSDGSVTRNILVYSEEFSVGRSYIERNKFADSDVVIRFTGPNTIGKSYVRYNKECVFSDYIQQGTLPAGLVVESNDSYVTSNSGSSVFSGDGSNDTFSINHGLSATPDRVVVTSRSVDSAGNKYTSGFDDTKFDVVFASPPSTGTDNIIIDWIAQKREF